MFGLTTVLGVVLAHDALTYRESHLDGVPTNPLALHPLPGGPKGLPVVSHWVEEEEDERAKQISQKERLVVVGGGWGGQSSAV